MSTPVSVYRYLSSLELVPFHRSVPLRFVRLRSYRSKNAYVQQRKLKV